MASTGWRPHAVRPINGRSGEIVLLARKHVLAESWNQVAGALCRAELHTYRTVPSRCLRSQRTSEELA